MVFASLSVRDPALIRGLAEQLAANFSARVDAAIPEIAEFIESGVGPRAEPEIVGTLRQLVLAK